MLVVSFISMMTMWWNLVWNQIKNCYYIVTDWPDTTDTQTYLYSRWKYNITTDADLPSFPRCFMETLTAPRRCRTSCGHPSWHASSASSPSGGTHALLCVWSCCFAWTNAFDFLLSPSLRPCPKTSSLPKTPSSKCMCSTMPSDLPFSSHKCKTTS